MFCLFLIGGFCWLRSFLSNVQTGTSVTILDPGNSFCASLVGAELFI